MTVRLVDVEATTGRKTVNLVDVVASSVVKQDGSVGGVVMLLLKNQMAKRVPSKPAHG